MVSTVPKWWFWPWRCTRSGQTPTIDCEQLVALVNENPHCTTRELALTLDVHHSTVHKHLKRVGFTSKLSVWVPRELNDAQQIARIDACDTLTKRQESDPFLTRFITGDETWIQYNNPTRQRCWSKRDELPLQALKRDSHQKKVMLSVWWDFKGIVHFELLPRNKTINSEIYCQQLERLSDALLHKRPTLVNRKGVIFHHDNATPHTSFVTRMKLLELGWEVIQHPPYSPDLAPSEYHLFSL